MPLWSEPNFPHKGWKSDTVIDLREDEDREFEEYADCQACDHERIRFVHILKHPEYKDPIRVGCVCAEKLTNDYVSLREKESALRSRATRRARFPKRKWKTSKQGNLYLNIDGQNVGVKPLPNGKFKVWIGKKHGDIVFDTLREAQLRIFDKLERDMRLKEHPRQKC